jgi:hypothetical protein
MAVVASKAVREQFVQSGDFSSTNQKAIDLLTSADTARQKTYAIVDAGKDPAAIHATLKIFAKKYELTRRPPKEADYIFHSGMGYEVLKYDGIRIFITGENVIPDFNTTDYAMAFAPISFGDRYCRLPLFRLYPSAYMALKSPRPEPSDVLARKTGFCAYVMSNMRDSATERVSLFHALDNYKRVASGGKWQNNVGGPVEDKIAFQQNYKFVLAAENSSSPGYLTEKFAQAAQSNAIPIYWGDPNIAEIFNPAAFVNCHDYATPVDVAKRVEEIDRDDNVYLAMLSEPWFPGGVEPESLKSEYFEHFFANIFEQPRETAYRRNRSRWGKKFERRLYDMAFRPWSHQIRRLREKRRRAR